MSAAMELEVPELIDEVLQRSGYMESLEAERTIEARGRWRTCRSSPASRANRRSRPRPDLSAFLQEISLVSDQDTIREDEDSALVTLMTLHNAKGLEFGACMIGMEEGIFPHPRSIEEQGIEEERRLGYVGMTRAQGAADADARDHRDAWAVRATTCRPASSTRCPIGSHANGCDRRRGRGTARRATPIQPREDVPSLSTGDSVRHSTLGEGVVVRSSRAASSRCASPTTAASEARARVRAARKAVASEHVRGPVRAPTRRSTACAKSARSASNFNPPSGRRVPPGARALLLAARQMHAALEDGQIVGGAGSVPVRAVRARRIACPCAGVTAVGVQPTHRRRGVLRSMMDAQLRDVHERGEPIAALWASEETIYGRFGYGLASWARRAQSSRTSGMRSPSRSSPAGGPGSSRPRRHAERFPPIYEPGAPRGGRE